MDDEKTVDAVLKKYKNSEDVVTEGELIQNYNKKFNFIFISTGKLYLLDLQKKKFKTYNFYEGVYQKCYDKLPFTLKFKDDLFLSFVTYQTYSKLVNYLKEKNYKELPADFHLFTTKLETTSYFKWTKLQVIEWLSFLYDKEIPLSELYEKNFMSNEIDGSKLSFYSEKEFIRIGLKETHSKILYEEVEKLIQNDYFNTDQARFRIKLEALYDPTDQRVAKVMREEEKIIFSLCDSEQILQTYLRVDPLKDSLHKNAEKYIPDDIIEVKLVISEMVHNRVSSGLYNSVQGTIESIPAFLDWKNKFGRFKCGIIIGPWYLEFTDTSIIVPKRISAPMNQIFSKIPKFTILKISLDEASKILSDLIVKWNIYYRYVATQPRVKLGEGNCYSFLEHIFQSFKISLIFKGSMYTFMNELKDFGDAGASIYPTDYLNEFETKFGFSYIEDIPTHEELDDYIGKIFDAETQFKELYPDDYLLFQAIDIAFWIRSFKSNDSIYQPLILDRKSCCPCFTERDFSLIRGSRYRPPSNNIKRRSFENDHREPRSRNSNVIFSKDPIFNWEEEIEEEEPDTKHRTSNSLVNRIEVTPEDEEELAPKLRTRSVVLMKMGESLKSMKKKDKVRTPKSPISMTPVEKLRQKKK
eukprot:gene10325-2741_t